MAEAPTEVMITDDAYVGVQSVIQFISRMLIDPAVLDGPTLDLFIRRAEYAMAVGPILHPSEFRDGAGKLTEVLACAYALRDAARKIAVVAAS